MRGCSAKLPAGSVDLRAQAQRAADAGALQLGQAGRQHRVPARDRRVGRVDVELQRLLREPAVPARAQHVVAATVDTVVAAGAASRVPLSEPASRRTVTRRLSSRIGALPSAGTVALQGAQRSSRVLVGSFQPKRDRAVARVERAAVEPGREPRRGGQADRGGHADVEAERARP